MTDFDLNQLAQELEHALQTAENPQVEVERKMRASIAAHGPEAIIAALEAAIPAGASIGELIVYRSPSITMLYGRIPPRFRSGIHDHTVFASIAQLSGAETSVVYERDESGEGLKVARSVTSQAGEVTSLPADAIHHIENPTDEVSAALHVYGGDFGAVAEDRSLWSYDGHERDGFSFEKLMQQSVVAMKKTGNARGLEAVVEAIPAARALVDAV